MKFKPKEVSWENFSIVLGNNHTSKGPEYEEGKKSNSS